MDKSQKKEELIKLKKKMEKDDLPLKEGATNLVFGSGNPDAKVMFIGEGPGYWEDQKGKPFVGNAGAFLNQLLRDISMEREKVFITNVLHYRPPNNRDPEPEEMEAFRPYLDKMIEIISPKVVVTLGRFSMAKFVPGVMISNVHGKPRAVQWKGKKIIIVPMYHPAAGLRNGEIKRRTIEDFKIIPEILADPEAFSKSEKDAKEKLKEADKGICQMQLI
ncbi:uracil-DNA glycosylase [Candidatus Woesebacteria bacterium]|nr:uracil-DNA glycosylase [Candidatus Woesebacteria bacterium]